MSINKIPTLKLRNICIRHNYFTGGDNRQYEKLFELFENNEQMHDIALIIWICSDTDKRPAEIGLELLREVYLDAESEQGTEAAGNHREEH